MRARLLRSLLALVTVSPVAFGIRTAHGTDLGLDFPGSGDGAYRFRWVNPQDLGFPIYGPEGNGVTYVWKAYPRQQDSYYTAFFHANDEGDTFSNLQVFYDTIDHYYGAHPYPNGGAGGSTHQWEISANGNDVVDDSTVVYDTWHTQVFQAWKDGSGYKHHVYYWDWPNQDRVIRYTVTDPSYGESLPPSPALSVGGAPWAPTTETWDGILRGFQFYAALLSLSDLQDEIDTPKSTAAGAASIWYLNLNPTPTDISDQSGAGHDPSWVGSNRPGLYSEEPQLPALSIGDVSLEEGDAGTVSATITVTLTQP